MFLCNKCNRGFNSQQGLNSHIGWHNKPERENNFDNYNSEIKLGTRKSTNQFIKAKDEGRIINVSQDTKDKISKKMKEQSWDDDKRKRHSVSMKKAVIDNPDSYSVNNVSGRVKTYIYNNIKLKGTWEVHVAKWLDDNNITWTNKIDGIPYKWENNTHLYFPDFYLKEYDLYIEVKGYQRDRDLFKWESVDNLLIIKEKDIKLIKENKFILKKS